jgi:hypothetical protein
VSIFNSRLFKNLIFFSFVAVMILMGGYGILLIIQASGGNGSSEGNSLIFVLGLILIIVSAFSLSIGVLYRKTISSAEGSKKRT